MTVIDWDKKGHLSSISIPIALETRGEIRTDEGKCMVCRKKKVCLHVYHYNSCQRIVELCRDCINALFVSYKEKI